MEKTINRMYSKEELKAMNYILGKSKENNTFTKDELEMLNKVDLLDDKLVEVCKLIWDNRNDEERLNRFLEIIREGRWPECI